MKIRVTEGTERYLGECNSMSLRHRKPTVSRLEVSKVMNEIGYREQDDAH